MDELNSSLITFFKDGSTWDTLQLEELIKEGVNLNGPLSTEDGSRPLHVAATKGDVNVVKTLLDHGAYVDVPDYFGNTPSHYSSREGHLEVLQLLIDRGANVNLTNDKGGTVLENAVCNEHLEVTKLLLSKGASVDDAKTALSYAVEKENFEITKELLKAGVKIKDDTSIMQKAVMKGNIELARVLVENGAYIGGKESYTIDIPPMKIAIKTGDYNMAVMFLENGVIVNNKHHMKMYLSMALENGRCKIAKLLHEKGAEQDPSSLHECLNKALEKGYVDTVKLILEMPAISEPLYREDEESSYFSDPLSSFDFSSRLEPKPHNGFNDALYNAVVSGNMELIQLVLERVTDVNTRGNDRKTPLILAAEKALIPVVKLLLEKGADISLCDKTGKTALYYAFLHDESTDIVEVLLDWGASVNDEICTESTITPLHLAASANTMGLIEFLLQRKANVNARANGGNTPLHALFENNNFDQKSLMACCKALLEEGADLNCSNYKKITPMMLAVNNCPTDVLRVFLETAFSVVRGKVVIAITPYVLSEMILNGHISLLKLVLSKIAEFHIEDLMKLNNISLKEITDATESNSFRNTSSKNELYVITMLYAAYVGDLQMADFAFQNCVNILNSSASGKGLSPLQIAVYSCNFEMVDFLIGKGASVLVRDKYQLLPLQLAILLGDTALAEKLYSKTTHKVSSVFRIPLLNLAAYHGNVDLVKLVLTKLSDIDTRDENMNTVLHIAVRAQSNELVNFCIENGVDINAQNALGDTAFLTALKILDATKSGDFEIAMNLLNRGVDIDISNSEGKTALHLATSHNLTPFIGILLERGVKDVNAEDEKRRTPFQQLVLNIKDEQSVPYNASDVVVLFLKYGADAYVYVDSEHTVIQTLLRKDFIDFDRIVLEFFPKWNQSPRLEDEDSWFEDEMITIMKIISLKKKYYLLDLMLNLGFTFNQRVALGGSLFHYIFWGQHFCSGMKSFILKREKNLIVEDGYFFKAIEWADLEIVKVFLEKSDVDTTDYANRSILQNALKCKNEQAQRFGLAQLFLDKGANVNNLKSNYGCVPSVEAASGGNWSMVNTLLDKGADVNTLDCHKRSILLMAVEQGNQHVVSILLKKGAITNIRDNFHHRTPLHYAAFHKNTEIAKLLLKYGAKVYFGDQSNKTPLHIAAEAGNHKTVELLLGAGADISVKDNAGNTPLHSTKSFEVAEVLIRNGASVREKNKRNQTSLHRLYVASKSAGNLKDTTELFIQNGAMVNEQDIDGLSPLHFAAQESDIGTLSVFVNKGATLDQEDGQGKTPLHHAVNSDRTDIVEYLVKQGASLEVKDSKGDTPVCVAFRKETIGSLLVLIKNGANIDVKDRQGQSLLHLAIVNYKLNLFECLISHGASLEVKDAADKTPLHLAANKITTQFLLVLISNGAKLDVKDHRGWTPLHHAVNNNRSENAELLLTHGASSEVKNASGETPLNLAGKNVETDALLVLIRNGAMLDAKDNKGSTALHHAANKVNPEVVKCLLNNGASLTVKNNQGETPYQLCRTFSMHPSRYGNSKKGNIFDDYIMLLKLAGLSIDENVKSKMREKDEENALKELDHMKVTKVNEGFYLTDIFTKSNRPSYLLDEDTMKQLNTLLQAPDFHQKFPVYADILKGTVARAKRSRYYLLRRATRSMMSTNRRKCCRDTPDLAWEKVCGYLSDEDLTNVIKSED